MAGLPRIVRGMLGTGLTFAVAAGALTSAVGVFAMVVGEATWVSVAETAGRISVASFILGVAFAALLALSARSRRLARLSIGRFAALGAGAGLLYFAFISTNGIGVWTPRVALLNFVLLVGLGGGLAAATLALARFGQRRSEGADALDPDDALSAGEASAALGAGRGALDEVAPARTRNPAAPRV